MDDRKLATFSSPSISLFLIEVITITSLWDNLNIQYRDDVQSAVHQYMYMYCISTVY